MNINQLKYFIAVAENKSFTKAAEQFYISQTAITQQIRSLEDILQCQLIDRGSRPLELTNAGKTFLIESRAIIERMDNAIGKTREASKGMSGILRIGYLKGYERSNLSNTIGFFHQNYPNVLISCYRNSSDELANGLLNGSLDMIISWDSTNLMNDPAIESQFIEDVPLVVALYASHHLAGRAYLERADLKNENIVYMTPSSTINSFGDAYFMELYKNAGYTPNILFSSCDYESILIMVASQQGISIMPEYCTKKLENADNLVFIPLVGKEEFEKMYCFTKKENNSIIIQKIKELL